MQISSRVRPSKQTHLYRGAPCVRSWSKYQTTVKLWSLCGIYDRNHKVEVQLQATEDPREVDCEQCVRLMHPGACGLAKTACGVCESLRPHTETVLR